MKTIFSSNLKHLLNLIVILILVPLFARAQIDPGLYTIRSVSAGKVLDAVWADMDTDGGKVQTWTYLGGANQHWKIAPSRTVSSTCNIRLAGTGKALDAAWNERFTNGGKIILWSLNDGESQRWRIEKISGNRYRIRLAVSNKLLSGTGAIDGSRVQLWDNLSNTTQEWIIEKVNRITISQKYVDLRPNQTSIKNQGGRGSCTVFGATAALEAAYKKAGYGDLDFSEEFFSMQGKALYLHPIWADTEARGAAATENQMAGTQGGGSVFIFKNGFALPREHVVPYQQSVAADTLWNKPEYKLQRNMDNYNFSLNTSNVLKAPKYYGASSVARLANPRSAVEYEQLLRQGNEIHFSVLLVPSNGFPDYVWRPSCNPNTSSACAAISPAHNMLIVGFDKTDPNPANHYFIVKNSWGSSGYPGAEGFSYMHYSYLNYVSSAEYILNVYAPKIWPELGLLGEYSLDFDGWKGRLDIYHLPGIAQWVFENNNVAVTDRRLGIFFDQSGKAFRVNGTVRRITNEVLEVTFYINSARPNPRWDELGGRKFIYYYDYRTDFMAGFHTDPGSTIQYAGYAKKATNSYIANSYQTPRPFAASSYKNSSWNLDISSGPKGKLYISQSGSTFYCTFYNNATRTVSPVSIRFTNAYFTQMEFRFDGYILKGQHLSHENGLIAGYDITSKKPFYMVRQSPQVADLPWIRVGLPLAGQVIDVCACNDGSLYALKTDKKLYKSTTGGSDASWVFVRTMPATTFQISCARNLLYFQMISSTGGGEIWYINGSTLTKTASLASSSILAGTEDNTLDFPYLYRLSASKELFRSSTSGVSWTKIGQPLSASRIAATQNALFALNGNGSFWINRYGGSDINWVKIDDLPQAIEITATSLGQTGKANIYYLHQDKSLWRTSVYDQTLGYNARTAAAAELPSASKSITEESFQLSPNPASSIIKLSYYGKSESILLIQIHDITGSLVKSLEFNNLKEQQVDVSDLSKGLYFVTLVHTEGKITKKLVIQ